MLWLPAIVGWGLPAHLVRRRLAGPATSVSIDLVEPIAGLALLAAAVTAANFFLPVGGLPLPLLVVGWLGLAARLELSGIPRISLAQVVAALAVLVLAAFLCRGMVENYDTGLYHAPNIEWFRANVTPLGLANLHGRLGFGSAWLAVSAVMEVPLEPVPNTHYFLPAAALTWLWAMSASLSIGRVLRFSQASLHDTFLALTPIAFYSETLTGNLPSPAPDLVVMLLSFLLVFLALRALGAETVHPADWWGLVVVAAFAAMVKLSAAPWLLLPFLVWWRARSGGAASFRRPAWRAVIAAVLVLTLPWLARGVAVSGCLAYPAPFTCLYPLPWAVPPNLVLRETVWVFSWARLPNHSMVGVISSLHWLPSWWARISAMPDMQILAGLSIIGLALVVFTHVAPRSYSPSQGSHFSVLGLTLGAGLAYWFATAPEPRFGVGYLWSAGLLLLGVGLHRLVRSGRQWSGPMPRVLRIGFGSLATALLVLAVTSAVLRRAAPLLTGHQSVLSLAPLPSPPYTTLTTLTGDTLYRPTQTDQCWLIPLPCTPFATEQLRLIRRADGQVTAIYR